MSATYSGQPGTSNRDRLRFAVGDVDMDDPILADGEVEYLLSTDDNFEQVTVHALEAIVSRLANEVSTAIGNSRAEAQHRYEHYTELLDRAERRLASNRGLTAKPYAGGISVSDKHNREARTDRVQPSFVRGEPHGQFKPRP